MDEYFIKRTDERLVHIEAKIDQLIGFRWMLLGASAVISSLCGIAVAVFFK